MTPTLDLPVAQPDYEMADDVARFATQVTEKDLDAAINGKKCEFTVQILRGERVVAEERNVLAMTGLEATQQVMCRTPGNYAFRPVAQ